MYEGFEEIACHSLVHMASHFLRQPESAGQGEREELMDVTEM